jgi:hypothetical protein
MNVTIVVAVAAPDGIVLSADSRASYFDGERHRVASDSSVKVFDIFGTIGVATYGLVFLGEKTIAGVIDEFVAGLPTDRPTNAADVAGQLAEFCDLRFCAAYPDIDLSTIEGALLGFLVASYDDDGVARIREVGIPGGGVSMPMGDTEISTRNNGVLWRGETDVIRRLVKGVDWNVLAAAGVVVPEEMQESLDGLEYNLLLPITLEDAVDFATFLIRTTIEMQRFSDGTALRPHANQTCGGDVRTLAVTRDGTQWVSEQPVGAGRRRG